MKLILVVVWAYILAFVIKLCGLSRSMSSYKLFLNSVLFSSHFTNGNN